MDMHYIIDNLFLFSVMTTRTDQLVIVLARDPTRSVDPRASLADTFRSRL